MKTHGSNDAIGFLRLKKNEMLDAKWLEQAHKKVLFKLVDQLSVAAAILPRDSKIYNDASWIRDGSGKH